MKVIEATDIFLSDFIDLQGIESIHDYRSCLEFIIFCIILIKFLIWLLLFYKSGQ